MPYETADEILAAVKSFQNDTNFLERRSRWERDFDFYRLKPYDAGRGYYSYTTNLPRVFADKVISLLSNSALLVSIPEELLTEAERGTASNVERFWYGCFNMNDEKLLLQPQKSTIRGQMAWYAAIRGGFGVRAYVYKNDKGETVPDVKIWDIYNMSYGQDSNGITWAAYTYNITRKQAKDEYKIDSGTGNIGNFVSVVDYWDDKKYCLIINNQIVNTKKHGLGYCPVALIGAGATPEVWQENYMYTGVHVGESVFAASRDIFPVMSKTYSDLITIVRRGVKVPMGYWSASGQKNIEEDIFQVDKAASIALQSGEEFKPLLPQTMPPDAGNAINIMSGEAQRGTWPYSVYGELGFRLSGFAINQLQASMATVIEPYSESIARAYQILCLWLLNQFTARDLPPIKVRGRTARNEAFGYPKAMTIKKSDLEGDWHPEVRLEPVLPKDDIQKYQLADMARDGEIPLLSDKTIRGDILGSRDPDLESDQIDREWADRQPINRMQDAYFRAVEAEDMLKASNILVALRMAMSQMGGAPRKNQGGRAPSAYEQGAGQAGMAPVGETGVPPQVMPAEAGGGFPPGSMNARPSTQGEY